MYGVKYYVFGIGGLLVEFEIVDFVLMFLVLGDVGVGFEFIRVLVGLWWRIGVGDLYVLNWLVLWLCDCDVV